jgi:hypothetical protein
VKKSHTIHGVTITTNGSTTYTKSSNQKIRSWCLEVGVWKLVFGSWCFVGVYYGYKPRRWWSLALSNTVLKLLFLIIIIF